MPANVRSNKAVNNCTDRSVSVMPTPLWCRRSLLNDYRLRLRECSQLRREPLMTPIPHPWTIRGAENVLGVKEDGPMKERWLDEPVVIQRRRAAKKAARTEVNPPSS